MTNSTKAILYSIAFLFILWLMFLLYALLAKHGYEDYLFIFSIGMLICNVTYNVAYKLVKDGKLP